MNNVLNKYTLNLTDILYTFVKELNCQSVDTFKFTSVTHSRTSFNWILYKLPIVQQY